MGQEQEGNEEKKEAVSPQKHQLTKWCKIIEVTSVKIQLCKQSKRLKDQNKYTTLWSTEAALQVQTTCIINFIKKQLQWRQRTSEIKI